VTEALAALEAVGVLSWVNRIVRIRERCEDLFGKLGTRWRVIRTSNAYQFNDPQPAKRQEPSQFSSKSEFPSGTKDQDSFSLTVTPCPAPLDAQNPLEAALLRFKTTLEAAETQN